MEAGASWVLFASQQLQCCWCCAGGVWHNDVAYKPFIAVDLEQYRENWRYNFLDKSWRKLIEGRAFFIEWDDHEVTNNW